MRDRLHIFFFVNSIKNGGRLINIITVRFAKVIEPPFAINNILTSCACSLISRIIGICCYYEIRGENARLHIIREWVYRRQRSSKVQIHRKLAVTVVAWKTTQTHAHVYYTRIEARSRNAALGQSDNRQCRRCRPFLHRRNLIYIYHIPTSLLSVHTTLRS